MTDLLLDTLIWTGALIAAVLVMRRPVARHFGAKAAYALWFLPLLRLFMPPIVLPAWMRPTEPATTSGADTAIHAEPIATSATAAIETVAVPTVQAVGAVPTMLPSPADLVTPLVILWLGGAAIFLIRRFSLYFEMRRDLLEGARPVGDVGKIRMVESQAADGPVAFGIFDKVVALPWGFMANRDRVTRDLAIAHELAHHRGRDLFVNFLAQPLFALHWFNPLGWMGWRAMRRDQEAACDMRVMATRSRDQRAHYADIIAGFATAAKTNPRLALAAPMACPVLGDKSIIHRLRNLTMPDLSKRRRFAGSALFVGAALTLPITATISYAAQDSSTPPSTPAPIAVAALPTLPASLQTAQDEETFEEAFEEAEAIQETVIEREIDRAELEIERAQSEIDKAESELDRAEQAIDSEEARILLIERSQSNWARNGELSAEERARLKAELKEARKALGSQEYRTEMRLALAEARASIPEIRHECKDGDDEIVQEYTTADGKTVLAICNKATMKIAFNAVKDARKAIKKDRNLTDQERRDALEAIDEVLDDLRDDT